MPVTDVSIRGPIPPSLLKRYRPRRRIVTGTATAVVLLAATIEPLSLTGRWMSEIDNSYTIDIVQDGEEMLVYSVSGNLRFTGYFTSTNIIEGEMNYYWPRPAHTEKCTGLFSERRDYMIEVKKDFDEFEIRDQRGWDENSDCKVDRRVNRTRKFVRVKKF